MCTFWRSAENFETSGITWAVSQASPLRRAVINGDIKLSEAGYSSGGYVSDVIVNGNIDIGSQQQFFFRNNKMISNNGGGGMNKVWVGCEGAPPTDCYTGSGANLWINVP